MTPRLGGNIFWRILLTPFTGRDAKTFFEHGVKQAEVPVAALVSDVDDLIVRTERDIEPTGYALKPQFNLPRAIEA